MSVVMERWSRRVNLSLLLPSNKCKYEGSFIHDILWTKNFKIMEVNTRANREYDQLLTMYIVELLVKSITCA